MLQQPPNLKELILIGSGHSHCIVLKKFAMNPVAGLQITVISDTLFAPYSGMLPGYCAGHYQSEEMHIDILRMCRWAGARLIHSRVNHINPVLKLIHCDNGITCRYDVASINVGSIPDGDGVAGVDTFAIPVKPISVFTARYQQLCHTIQAGDPLIVVGGGVAGFELAMALRHRFSNVAITLLEKGATLLRELKPKARTICQQHLKQQNIQVYCNAQVTQLTPTHCHTNHHELPYQGVFWVTQGRAPQWLGDSGLALSQDGSVVVNTQLETSHPGLFASGDCAHIQGFSLPKAGVYAVRQGPILYENLNRRLFGKTTLIPYKPQKYFLRLITLGEKRALAHRKFTWGVGRLLWTWKNHIDQRFMAGFQPTASMTQKPHKALPNLNQAIQQEQQRCQGCAAKFPGKALHSGLQSLSQLNHSLKQFINEDAATIDLRGQTLIQSVDTLTIPIPDPYTFGQIAVVHSSNDIVARGGKLHSCLAAVTIPADSELPQFNSFQMLMEGVTQKLQSMNCQLIGGHTSIGNPMSISLTINGLATETIWSKTTLQAGDAILLTKPLGSGLLLKALMENQLTVTEYSNLLHWMTRSHSELTQYPRCAAIHAVTDVSGFGLAGHLKEMLTPSTHLEIYLDRLPLYAGASTLIQRQVTSSSYQANYLYSHEYLESPPSHPLLPILFDPQTSGGLLIAIAAEDALDLKKWLREQLQLEMTEIIGSVTATTEQQPAKIKVFPTAPSEVSHVGFNNSFE